MLPCSCYHIHHNLVEVLSQEFGECNSLMDWQQGARGETVHERAKIRGDSFDCLGLRHRWHDLR
jgi:hypothetical protein